MLPNSRGKFIKMIFRFLLVLHREWKEVEISWTMQVTDGRREGIRLKGSIKTLNVRQAEMLWHRNPKDFLLFWNTNAKISLLFFTLRIRFLRSSWVLQWGSCLCSGPRNVFIFFPSNLACLPYPTLTCCPLIFNPCISKLYLIFWVTFPRGKTF